MITGVNRKLGTKSPFSYLRRDFYGIFQEHRRLFPHSSLRMVFIGSASLLMISYGLSYFFIQK